MSFTTRKFHLAILFALFSALFVACSPAEVEPEMSLHLGNSAEPLTLDPHKASGTWENNIIGDMFIGLTTEDEFGKPIPGMAKSWEVSPNGLVWTFALRDANWSDGRPVKAQDFVTGFRRLFAAETLAQYASLQYAVRNAEKVHKGELPPDQLGVRAIDEKTLEMTLEYPAPYLPGLLTHYTAFAVPTHLVEKYGDDWIQPENIEVNGAFKLAEWRTNDYVRVVKNENFYDVENVCLNEVLYYPAEVNAMTRRYRNGEFDLVNDFPGQMGERLREEFGDEVRIHPYMGTWYYVYNTLKPPFDDARVRRALSMAVDREFIVDEIRKSGDTPASALVPPSVDNYSEFVEQVKPNWFDDPIEVRREKARLLLEAAGFGPDNPLKFEFTHRTTGDNPRIAPVLQNDWASIAPWVQAEISPIETQIHYDRLRAGDFEVGDAGWIADFNDAKNFLYLLETATDGMNYGKYSNPDFDLLMQLAALEQDMNKRAQLMRQAEEIIAADQPQAQIFWYTNRALVSSDVTGYEDNLTHIHRSRFICKPTKEGDQ